MCKPEFYGVNYVINPWMSGNINNVDYDLAMQQWNTLYDTISKFAEVELITPIEGLPDMVFTANAGAFFNGRFFVSNFKHEERKGEEKYFKKWAEDKGYGVIKPIYHFEGAGDFLYSGISKVHFMGFYKRTQFDAMKELLVGATDMIYPLKLVTQQFYHLDTCFCPLNKNVVMMYRAAIDYDSWSYIDFLYEGRVINVSKEDADLFACNAVNIGDEVILPMGISDNLRSKLQSYGYNVHEVQLSEFIKAGGAAKCLTLQI
jgi:N-dimethylarginine dimethylaminohydrolase